MNELMYHVGNMLYLGSRGSIRRLTMDSIKCIANREKLNREMTEYINAMDAYHNAGLQDEVNVYLVLLLAMLIKIDDSGSLELKANIRNGRLWLFNIRDMSDSSKRKVEAIDELLRYTE